MRYDLVYHKEGRDDDNTWFLCGVFEDEVNAKDIQDHVIECAERGIIHEVQE